MSDHTESDQRLIVLAANRGREEFHEGRTMGECPYHEGDPLRPVWVAAWLVESSEVTTGITP